MGPAPSGDLRAHAARGALFVVHEDLDLLEVAVAVARDDAARVTAWIASRQLRRPDKAEYESFSSPAASWWTTVVVQPFVLAQPRPVAPPPHGERPS